MITTSVDTLTKTLATALHYAGTDQTLPTLCAVQITYQSDKQFTARATDRYVLGVVANAAGDGTVCEPFEPVIIARPDVTAILAMIKNVPKALHRSADVVKIRADDRALIVEAFGASMRVVPVDGSYPQFEALFPKLNAELGAGSCPQAFNPLLLERLAKSSKTLQAKNLPVRWFAPTTPGKPVVFTLGNSDDVSMIGLIMPIRPADEPWHDAARWTDLLRPGGEAPAPKSAARRRTRKTV